MYLVVVFTDSMETAVVPDTWVDKEGNQCCLWPPFRSSTRLCKAVKEKATPDRSWQSYPYRLLYQSECYDKARQKLSRSDVTSDLASSDTSDLASEGQRKERNVRPPIRYAEDPGSSDSNPSNDGPQSQCSSNTYTPLLTVADGTHPQNWNSNGYATVQAAADGSQSRCNGNGYAPLPAVVGHSLSQQFPNAPRPPMVSRMGRPLSQPPAPFIPPSSDQHACAVSLQDVVTTNRILEAQNRRIFEVLEKQAAEMKEMKRLLQNVLEPTQPFYLPDDIKFPVEAFGDLERIEEYLLTPLGENSVLYNLRCIGGGNPKETTTNILKYIFGKDMALAFCWKGSNGRRAFSVLRLKTIVFRAVRLNPICSKVTDTDMKKITQEWFRTAADRHGGRRARTQAGVTIVS